MGEFVINAIAAFPWVTCNEPIEVGPVRILPYERGRFPGDLTHAKQSEIDAILEAFGERTPWAEIYYELLISKFERYLCCDNNCTEK